MIEMFPRDKGPHKVKTMTGKAPDWAVLAAIAAKSYSEIEKKAQEGDLVENTTVAEEATRTKRAEASKRAREALAKAQATKASRRRITLKCSDPAEPAPTAPAPAPVADA